MGIRTILLIVLLAVSQITLSKDTLSPDKAADIKLLLQLTNAEDHLKAYASSYMHVLTVNIIDKNNVLSKDHMFILENEINAIIAEYSHAENGFYEKASALYDEKFTDSEIRELLNFYNSETGRKALSELPLINNRLKALTNEWNAENMHYIVKRLKDRLRTEGLDVEF